MKYEALTSSRNPRCVKHYHTSCVIHWLWKCSVLWCNHAIQVLYVSSRTSRAAILDWIVRVSFRWPVGRSREPVTEERISHGTRESPHLTKSKEQLLWRVASPQASINGFGCFHYDQTQQIVWENSTPLTADHFVCRLRFVLCFSECCVWWLTRFGNMCKFNGGERGGQNVIVVGVSIHWI
jgi:hypothetical protein